jgi:TonB family protein
MIMKKSNLIYVGAFVLIASVICVESSFASEKTNKAKSVSTETEMRANMASDSVTVSEQNNKIGNLIFMTESMDGAAVLTYLKNNIRYPKKEIEDGTEGYVKVLITVEKNGTVSNVLAIEGNNNDFSKEVVKTLRNARFQPILQNGYAARYNLIIPVNFKLLD